MDRMKTFFKYILVLVLFFVFSNLIINALLKNSYTDIKNSDINIDVDGIYVGVDEAKVSGWNGNVKGIVKNNSNQVIENKYIKFSMLSKKGHVLGEKYVKIEKLEVDEIKNYEVDFDYDNVKGLKIELTDTMPEGVSFFELIKQNVKDIGKDVL